jgi:hypothetical protein
MSYGAAVPYDVRKTCRTLRLTDHHDFRQIRQTLLKERQIKDHLLDYSGQSMLMHIYISLS